MYKDFQVLAINEGWGKIKLTLTSIRTQGDLWHQLFQLISIAKTAWPDEFATV